MLIRGKTPGVVPQIVAAALLASLGIAVRFIAIGPAETHLPYVTLYPPVILAALYGGLYCGLLTTLILVVFCFLWIVPPHQLLSFPGATDAIGIVLFAASSIMICAVSHAMHRARARTLAAEAEVCLAKEREIAAQAVRDSEQLGRQITTSIQEGVVVLDRDLRYRFWNEFMERISGIPASDVLGKHPDEVFPWMREQGLIESFERALKGESTLHPDVMAVLPTGRRMWVAGRDAPLRNAAGEITGVIATIQDIHERKASERALEDSQRRLRIALAASQASVFEWNPNTGELYWSPESYEIYGYDPSIGSPTVERWQSRVHPDDLERVKRSIRTALESPDTEYRAEFRIRHPQRGERWLLGFGRVERDARGKALRLAGMTIDVTERKLAEGVLIEATRRARCILNVGEVEAMEGWQQRVGDPNQHPFLWAPGRDQ